MTLAELLYAINDLAIKQKIINFAAAGADMYVLNSETIKDYPVLFTSPTGTHIVKENSTRFAVTIYYFDRLLTDSQNDIDVMSTSVEELKNLIRGISNIPGVVGIDEEWALENFVETEAFNDRIAGSYATLVIEVVNNTICYEN